MNTFLDVVEWVAAVVLAAMFVLFLLSLIFVF